eukprot:TRINITY_DN807_c0_g1_i7.p1 TRINITY_DN807_c0_g1~~TRINITY_DN807_c0_g1_i7.p1  ORF type:complete len:251 (+),score=82.60 TRINITY_DN807_c0_g1_i7:271-1023(+)
MISFFYESHIISDPHSLQYMACMRPPSHGGFIKETDAILPKTRREKKYLRRINPYQFAYGGNKLKIEQTLFSAHAARGFPFVSLRLTDVIGPYDNLGSHMAIMQALTRGERIGTRIDAVPHPENYRFSTVYAPDVIDIIVKTMESGNRLIGQTFNVANEANEAVTIFEYVELIAEAMNMNKTQIDYNPLGRSHQPSTDFGPIDVSNLLTMLPEVKLTPVKETIRLTTLWNMEIKNQEYTSQFVDSDSDSD